MFTSNPIGPAAIRAPGSTPIPPLAFPLLCGLALSSCARGQSGTAAELGLVGLPPEFSELAAEARNGDTAALLDFARRYETGDSLEVDVPRARRIYRHVIDLKSDAKAAALAAQRLRETAGYANVTIKARAIRTTLYATEAPKGFDPCSYLMGSYARFISPRPTGQCVSDAYTDRTGRIYYTVYYDDELSAEPHPDGYTPSYAYQLRRGRRNCGRFLVYSFAGASPEPIPIVSDVLTGTDPVIPTNFKPLPEPC